MKTSRNSINFERIQKAIAYIREHYQQQPSLEQIADSVGMSRYHFQKTFTEWAGVSPKKFIQYLSLEHAKKLLESSDQSLMDVSYDLGMSGSSRLHDLFVNIEGMTPGEFRNGGDGLNINYCFADTLFGEVIVASTEKGVCHLSFQEDKEIALQQLIDLFPLARLNSFVDHFQQQALSIFSRDWNELKAIKLHLAGTEFQLKVWQSLLKVPHANLTTYRKIAESIGKPKAVRAVGTAIGKNPIAFIIPCHRVIQTSGCIGGYRWGEHRKSALIGWESAEVGDNQ